MEVQNQYCPCCWNKRLFAWIMSQGSGIYNQLVDERKQALFADLHGNVLEISPGTGSNLPYYPKDINWIGVEPNPYMHSYLRKQAEEHGIKVYLRLGTAEQLKIEDNSLDTVVSTLVLCSVPDLTKVLQEILRVLKPGGRFLFIEHIAAPPDTWLRTTQKFVRPIWRKLGDGCYPDRETLTELIQTGFEYVECEKFQVPVLIVSPHIAGIATKKINS